MIHQAFCVYLIVWNQLSHDDNSAAEISAPKVRSYGSSIAAAASSRWLGPCWMLLQRCWLFVGGWSLTNEIHYWRFQTTKKFGFKWPCLVSNLHAANLRMMIPHDLQLTTMFFRQGKTVISELAMFCTSKFGCPKPLVSSWKNDKFSDDVGVMVRTSFFRKGIGGSPCSSGNIQTSKRPWFLATQWRGDQALDWVWKWWIQHDTTPIYDHLWLRLFDASFCWNIVF